MGQRAWAARVCESAVVASIALLGASCLNELEPSIASNLCRGNVPDGVLDPGEECDDANGDVGDGCDLGCRVACPPGGLKDPVNAHCYFFLPSVAVSHEQADNACQRGSSLLTRLATVRSAREAAFLRDEIARARPNDAPARLRTAYSFGRTLAQLPIQLAPDQAPIFITLNFRQAAPSPFQAQPGLLAYYTTGTGPGQARSEGERPCTGCYGAVALEEGSGVDGEQWWGPLSGGQTPAPDPDEVPEKGLAFDLARGLFTPVELDQADELGAFETLCERVPDSMPLNECAADPPACPGGASLRFRLGGSLYSYFDEALAAPDAAARCAGIGASLWVIDDEEERERVVRLLAADSAPISFSWPIPTRWGAWVGASKQPGGAWAWADGSPAAGERAVPWAVDPAPDWGTDCGYVLLRGDGFDRVEAASSDVFAVGLVIPTVCAPAIPPGESAFPGLLCEQAAP